MDGLQAKLKSLATFLINSLQFRLALALSITMVIAAIAISAIGYDSTMRDVHQTQDDHLRDIASMVNTGRVAVNQTHGLKVDPLEDPDSHVVVQLVGSDEPDNRANAELRFPSDLKDGLQTLQVQQNEWRAFVQAWPAGGKLVVAQLTEARDEIARHAGNNTLHRILAVIPFMIILLVLMLRWMLSPLSKLSAELNSRSPEDIRAISDQGLPTELLPFVSSTNTVLNRIAVVLEQQRRFVADAAHELRSPLTALTLQTKNLTLQEMSEEAHQRVEEFDRGLKRANDLVDQLLTMARSQLAEPQRIAQVSLEQTVKVVFEELIPFADTKKIRLSFTQPSTMAPVLSGATQTDWITLVRNLVDNAIRYSSAQGRVEVAVAADENQITIDVIDNGPGIAVQERERVFDSFYRVLGTEQSGSGLGLSIVKSIVTTVHGDISLAFSDPVAKTGTIVSVKIPQAKQIA